MTSVAYKRLFFKGDPGWTLLKAFETGLAGEGVVALSGRAGIMGSSTASIDSAMIRTL